LHRSLWLLEVPLVPDVQPALEGEARADIAIAGGGYVGLWTALLLKEHDPACEVAIVEQDFCGSGASGRNGGFALSWWAKLKTLTRLCGQEDGVRLAKASEDALSEIDSFCRSHGIDAHFTRGGWLWTATTASQMGSWEACVALAERQGVGPWQRLDPDEVAARAGSRAHLGGVLDTSAMRPLATGVLGAGETADLGRGLTVSFPDLRQYTVLTVGRDRGLLIVLAAAILILLGLLPALYTSRRKLWVTAEADGAGTLLKVGGFALQRRSQFEEEFSRLVRELERVPEGRVRS